MKKIATTLAAVVALAAFTACEVPDESGTAADRTDTSGAATAKAKTADGAKGKNKKDAPKETSGQANAREAAANYLDLTGFSRQGLIDQLINGDGYSKADATYGADAQHADYKKQAALSAKQYLDLTAFSRSGLIDQLVDGDGYTKAQAVAGANAVGLK